VTIDITAGGGITPFISNAAGTAQDGYTVRVGSFLSADQSAIEALSYNKLWVGNQFTLFGSGTTETLLSQAGSFDPSPNLTNSSDALKGQQAWLVYSDAATLGSSTAYGVATSSSATWTIPNASPWVTFIDTNDITTVAYGTLTGTSGSDSLRTAAAPTTNLYWDSNGAAGRGGSGTWSSLVADTEWTTNSSGLDADGTFAWGSTSGSDYYAGAGLTANFGGDAGTVTVSGTVDALSGLTFETTGYTLTSGTINLAGATAADNTISSTGTTTINSVLSGSTGLTKAGNGTVALSAANTFTGNTTVSAGTLEANAAGALGNSTVINVNGGSFLVSASNSVNDSAAVNLNGGTLAIDGTTNETVGALTLSANSVIDLRSFSGNLSFANSSAALWTVETTLSIWNWNGTNQYGTSYGAGDRHIFFGNNASGLSSNQLAQISFYSDSGSSFIGNAWLASTGEIGVVPEPQAIVTAAILLLGMSGYLIRLKISRRKNTSPSNQKIPTADRLSAPIASL
jgi:autotransporter-associated beta strand protein